MDLEAFWIVLGVIAGAAVLFFAVTYSCYCIAFYAPNLPPKDKNAFTIPPGKVYKPHREAMIAWMKEVRAMPRREFTITSFDGLPLHGYYYEYAPGAPVEIMFHGYRGTSERDLCGGVQRCFSLGHSAFVVDQRTSGKSGGHTISFGVNESRDCLAWTEFLIREFGPEVKILLTGISMGAATVMMAAGNELPPNVAGVLADCGYTSAPDIIKKVIRQFRLPVRLLYPVVRLAARIYGGFDPEKASPIEAMRRCKVPVIFVHGESDDFVPCEMSRQNYEACTAPKLLLTVPGAGHGLSYLIDGEGYLSALKGFWEPYGLV